MSDFQGGLLRCDRASRARLERDRREAEQAAMPTAAETARWQEVLAQRCREARAATGSGICGSAPRADGVGRSIEVLQRGTHHWKTLRLTLDHVAWLLAWQHVENGWVRQAGKVSMRGAESDGTIRDVIGDFVEWSADVAPR
jgi:hypothetical protein